MAEEPSRVAGKTLLPRISAGESEAWGGRLREVKVLGSGVTVVLVGGTPSNNPGVQASPVYFLPALPLRGPTPPMRRPLTYLGGAGLARSNWGHLPFCGRSGIAGALWNMPRGFTGTDSMRKRVSSWQHNRPVQP